MSTSSSSASPDITYQPTAVSTGHRHGNGSPLVHCFFDNLTSTWTYLVVDPTTNYALVIDPVLEFDPASGSIGTESVQGLTAFIAGQGYKVTRIIETHIHADHATGARALKSLLPTSPPIYIGEDVSRVQGTFAPKYGIPKEDFDGSFDGHLRDEDIFQVGQLRVNILGLPGHTPDSMGILVSDCLFAGDSIFAPDVGTARADFPGGSADALYSSIQRIMRLGGDTKVFSGHDYPKNRDRGCMSTLSEQIQANLHVGYGQSREAFIEMRQSRDKQLGTPRLLHASLQINLRGGRLPKAEEDGRRFIRTPLKGDFGRLEGGE